VKNPVRTDRKKGGNMINFMIADPGTWVARAIIIVMAALVIIAAREVGKGGRHD
jgi:hypothetical protein